MLWLAVLASWALCYGPFARAEEAVNGPSQANDKMAWWKEAKFGMFIHWGVYAVAGGIWKGKKITRGGAEWIMRKAKIPVKEYRTLAAKFNPIHYDPEQWVKLAKEAGMKYIVITAKHHDGFALFDSKVTDWDVVDATPWKKDLLQPLAAAARKHGLKFGLYYSQAQDWVHPGGGKSGMKEGKGWCPEHQGSFDEYLQKISLPQVKEILETFHPDILWWDTPVWMRRPRAEPFHKLVQQYPNLITNNRLGGGFKGDFDTPEQRIPKTKNTNRCWETCMTMNRTWGFRSYDHNWKSTRQLVRNLIDIVSKGGNFLLNVGPDPQGRIPEASVTRLIEIGKWMKVNGEAIYGTSASPCDLPQWGRITQKDINQERILYLHVFNWSEAATLNIPVNAEGYRIIECSLLADPERKLEVKQQGSGLIVTLAGKEPDAICSVIKIRLAKAKP
ncbi:MAG: alpha-L-fucosidase [Lentisphaerae bacterium]|nr:MAG: alpha-L-fucosidase [Lentisphaerota bacterium]